MVPKFGSPGDTIIWPAECGAPSVYLHGARLPTLCYRIHAIGHTTLGLDQQVLDRIRTWRSAPATQDGQPVGSTVCLRTEFVEPPKERYQRITRSH